MAISLTGERFRVSSRDLRQYGTLFDGGEMRCRRSDERTTRTRLAGIASAAAAILGTSTVARAQDPFTDKPTPVSSGSAGTTAPPPSTVPAPVEVEGCSHITSALCGKQNTLLMGTAAGYVAVCVLVVSLWRWWWNKKGTSSSAARFWIPLLLGGAAAGTLAGLDPARGPDLKCCLASGVFRPEILLQDSSVGRAILLGALPAIVLYSIVTFITGMLKRS